MLTGEIDCMCFNDAGAYVSCHQAMAVPKQQVDMEWGYCAAARSQVGWGGNVIIGLLLGHTKASTGCITQ